MRPTTWRLLLAVAAIAFGRDLGACSTVGQSRTGTVPDVPWPSAVVAGRVRRCAAGRGADPAAAAAARARGTSRSTRSWPPGSRVLALACSRAGALFVGVYAAFLATALTDLSIPYRRHLALVSGACVLGALLVLVAGLLLERLLRLPEPPPGPDRPEATARPD